MARLHNGTSKMNNNEQQKVISLIMETRKQLAELLLEVRELKREVEQQKEIIENHDEQLEMHATYIENGWTA